MGTMKKAISHLIEQADEVKRLNRELKNTDLASKMWQAESKRWQDQANGMRGWLDTQHGILLMLATKDGVESEEAFAEWVTKMNAEVLEEKEGKASHD